MNIFIMACQHPLFSFSALLPLFKELHLPHSNELDLSHGNGSCQAPKKGREASSPPSSVGGFLVTEEAPAPCGLILLCDLKLYFFSQPFL